MIPDSFIEQLKRSTDIERIVSTYVSLKRKGNRLTGLCPFHSEKTPSFTVFLDNQSYYCFGCGAGGDAITFIRQMEHLEYVEAVKLLAEKAGLRLPEGGMDDQAARNKLRVLELNRESARFFRSRLKSEEGRAARRYLLDRGLQPGTITRFGLGYAPDSWDSLGGHLRGKGYSQQELVSAGVVRQRSGGGVYDAFRERIIFPIIDLRGNVIAFGGRALSDKGPKYLNSPDTPVFKKSHNLYALGFAKEAKADTLLLAEGYMDVITIHQAGFPNTVATLGTALTAEQARLISLYTKNVVIAYDADGAGQNATKKAIGLFSQTDVSVRVLEMTDAKDPDEYIKKYGAARFGNLIASGKGAVHFEIEKLKAGYDLSEDEDKVAFLNAFCRLMADIPGDLQREVYTGRVADELGVSKEQLILTTKSLVKKKLAAKQRQDSHNLRAYPHDKVEKHHRPHSQENLTVLVAQEKLVTILMQNPDYFDDFQSKMVSEDFADPCLRTIYTVLCDRLRAGQPVDLTDLSPKLEPAQMSRLSGLLAASRDIRFSRSQVGEYCAALKNAASKTAGELRNETDEETLRYINTLTLKKK